MVRFQNGAGARGWNLSAPLEHVGDGRISVDRGDAARRDAAGIDGGRSGGGSVAGRGSRQIARLYVERSIGNGAGKRVGVSRAMRRSVSAARTNVGRATEI